MVNLLSDRRRCSLVDVEALHAKVGSRYLSWPLVDGHVFSSMTDSLIPQVSSCLSASAGKS